VRSEILQAVIGLVRETIGLDLEGCEVRSAAGGCINQAYCVSKGEDESLRVFVKVNHASALSMFEAEAEGLSEIAGSGAIRVPQAI
jgi:fructosamine-3-kinase